MMATAPVEEARRCQSTQPSPASSNPTPSRISQRTVACLKLERKDRKNWRVMEVSSCRMIFRLTSYSAVVAAPMVKMGMEQTIQRIFSQQL